MVPYVNLYTKFHTGKQGLRHLMDNNLKFYIYLPLKKNFGKSLIFFLCQ